MAEGAYNKPLPIAQPESDLYWEKAKAHELWVMRCNDCNDIYFYPRAICPNCFGRNTEWVKHSGKGTLYTYAIVHRAPMPGWRDDVPYVVAMVELEGSTARMPTNIVGVEPDPKNLKVGMPLEVVFEDVTEKVTLPKFKPA